MSPEPLKFTFFHHFSGHSNASNKKVFGFNLPKSVSYQHMNWATVTETGTRITVPKSTVTLTIPQGAVTGNRTQDIYVSQITNNPDSKLTPFMRQNRVVTPIVQWGTSSNRKLLKPVVLSIPHQNLSNSTERSLSIFHCADIDNPEWQPILNCQENLQIDPSFCHVVTEKMGSYLIISHENSNSNFRIMSESTKMALGRCLDVPTCQGNDWRKLAQVLGIQHLSAHFANQQSPSEAILNLWESRNSNKDSQSALLNLAALLREINRLDAVVILERELKK